MNTATAPATLRRIPIPAIAAKSPSARLALIAVLCFNFFRLSLSFGYELFPQEAYYFFYSQHLALSYFDHPPVIAWLIRLFTFLFGPREISLRLTAFSLAALTQLIWVKLVRDALPSRARPTSALLLVCTGFFTVVSLAATPDAPLVLFWCLSLQQLHAALFRGRLIGWIIGGLAMGLAFDSKYTGIFLQLGLALFLVASSRHRWLLKTPWPYLSWAIAQLTATPVYWWNAEHRFASFLFQSAERAETISGLHLRYFLALLGSQTALLLPPLFIAIVWLAVRLIRRALRGALSTTGRTLFFSSFFLPMSLGFLIVSLFTLVKPNWLIPAYLSAILLVAPFARRWWRWNVGLSGVAHLLAAVELVLYPIRIASDDTSFGWRQLAAKVRQLALENPGTFVFSADGYKTSAELSFYVNSKVYGPNIIGQRGLQFDYVDNDLSPLQGRDALWIKSAPRDFTPMPAGQAPTAAERFDKCEELPPILILQQERIARKFYAYRCRDYRPPR